MSFKYIRDYTKSKLSSDSITSSKCTVIIWLMTVVTCLTIDIIAIIAIRDFILQWGYLHSYNNIALD